MPVNKAADGKSQKQVRSGYTDAVHDDLVELCAARRLSPSDFQRHATLRALYGIVGPDGGSRQRITWPKLAPVIQAHDLGLSLEAQQAITRLADSERMSAPAFLGRLITKALYGGFRRPAATPLDFTDSMLAAWSSIGRAEL
jgi:hypothetical protein